MNYAVKTIEESFVDWESHVFGFGYGTGEPHTLAALKGFMEAVGRDDTPHGYDYEKLEAALGPTVTWLLINILCRHGVDIIEYGTSPRYGWLTKEGQALRNFLATKTVEELAETVCADTDHDYCWPGGCNCGPNGFEKGKACPNPFWVARVSA